MAFRRRMAGAELAAHPLTDVGQQLNEARGALRRAMVAANPDIMGTGDIPYSRVTEAPHFDEGFDVKGHHVGLHARAHAVNLPGIDTLGPLEKRQMGDKATYDILAANPPTVEYNMSWDVDHNYGDANVSGRDAIAIGRATQKKWDEIIHKMPDNALVTNSPVGASNGDFKRADIYMASGFGPVQVDGNQYGIVKGGKIIPLSPLAPQAEHAKHLAGRARMAGEVKLGDEVLAALNAPGRSDLVEWSGSDNSELAGRKNGLQDSRYEDYDGYDDDYIPPINSSELRQDAERYKQDIQNPEAYGRQRRGIPEIGIRGNADEDIINRGLSEDLTAAEIQEMRDAQIAMLRQPGAGRELADQINAVMPRPLPQRITTDDLGGGYYNSRYTDIENVDAFGRRDVARDRVQAELDDLVLDFDGSERSLRNNSRGENLRDNIKDNSLDIDREGGSGVAFAQEIFDAGDVETMRQLQQVLAQNGLKSQPLNYRNRAQAARRPSYRENSNLVRPNERVNFVQRRNDQQNADMDIAAEIQSRNAREREVLELVDERFAPDEFEGRPRLFHNVYGAQTIDELLANNPASPRVNELNNREALRVVAQSVEQPGSTDAQEFADALRVVQSTARPSASEGEIVERVLGELVRQPAGQPVSSNYGRVNPIDMRNPSYVEPAPRRRPSRRPQQFDESVQEMTMEELMAGPTRQLQPSTGNTLAAVANNPAASDLADAISDESASRRNRARVINPALERNPSVPRFDNTPRPANNRRSTARQPIPSLEAPPAAMSGLGGALRQQDAMVQQARRPAQTLDDAPEGMSMDEFLAWNDRASRQRRAPQPNRPNPPQPASWNMAPLVPDYDDIPF